MVQFLSTQTVFTNAFGGHQGYTPGCLHWDQNQCVQACKEAFTYRSQSSAATAYPAVARMYTHSCRECPYRRQSLSAVTHMGSDPSPNVPERIASSHVILRLDGQQKRASNPPFFFSYLSFDQTIGWDTAIIILHPFLPLPIQLSPDYF